MRDRAAPLDARRGHELFEVRRPSGVPLFTTKHRSSASPMRLLRTFPPLEALPVIGIAVTLVRDLPTDLYDELVKHPYAMRD